MRPLSAGKALRGITSDSPTWFQSAALSDGESVLDRLTVLGKPAEELISGLEVELVRRVLQSIGICERSLCTDTKQHVVSKGI